MFYAVNREGSYQGETRCIATTCKLLIHCVWHTLMFMIGEVWGEMKSNESGWQKLGIEALSAGAASMQSCILTYSRLRKTEPLIALSSHQEGGGGLNVCIRGTPPRNAQKRQRDVYRHPAIARKEKNTGKAGLGYIRREVLYRGKYPKRDSDMYLDTILSSVRKRAQKSWLGYIRREGLYRGNQSKRDSDAVCWGTPHSVK